MLTLKAFEEAVDVVKKVAMETELIYSDYLSGQTGNKVYLKPENLQVTGAYKIRGAYYKISTLTEEQRSILWKLLRLKSQSLLMKSVRRCSYLKIFFLLITELFREYSGMLIIMILLLHLRVLAGCRLSM